MWRRSRQRHASRALFLIMGRRVCRYVKRIWRDQRDASLIDYAILVAMITVLVVLGVAFAAVQLPGGTSTISVSLEIPAHQDCAWVGPWRGS
jgi:Flp pilus assembly pilin Flp